MTSSHKAYNLRRNSQYHNYMLMFAMELFVWVTTIFQGARSFYVDRVATLVFVIALGATPSVLAETWEDYTYNVDNQEATITGYTGTGGDVVIPNSIDGNTVTGIGNDAFRGCTSLISVKIPAGVTRIGRNAFSGCSSLIDVVIPDGVTSVEACTFSGCINLVSVEIPTSVTCIGESAFYNCSSLANPVIPEGVTSIKEYTFYKCTSLNEVEIPHNLTCIEKAAFMGCTSLTSVVISNSVISIKDYAFSSCSLLSDVVIGNSVTDIGYKAFEYCSGLTDLVIPGNVQNIWEEAFSKCSNLTNLVIEDGVISIKQEAFSKCVGLVSVMIPGSVTNIGERSFYGCSGLTGVEIEGGGTGTVIGAQAFRDCYNLTNLEIGDGVTYIGDAAFWSTGLLSVVIPEGVTNIGASAFRNCTSLTDVQIPASVTNIGTGAFWECSALADIIVAEANSNYCSAAGVLFDMDKTSLILCSAQKAGDYQIPNSVTSIEDYAFYECESLTSVLIPASVTGIGNRAFYRCSSLIDLLLPDSITDIGEYAFSGCFNLTSVVIGDGVTCIRRETFSDCCNLTHVVIGNSVANLGNNAFAICGKLTNIYFTSTPPRLSHGVFRDSPATICYISGTEGWDQQYGGRPTAEWINKVIFNGNGGTPVVSEQTYNVGIPYAELPTANRTGYSFDGWWTALDEDAMETTAATLVPLLTTEHMLYAKWTINRYTINFDSAGGTAVAAITQDYDAAITAPDAPTKGGYTFAGWLPKVPATMPLDGLTCVAQWTLNEYILEYVAGENGTVNGMESITQKVKHGQDAEPVTAIPNDGYRFLKWSDDVTSAERTDLKVVAGLNATAEFGSKLKPELNWPVPGPIVYGTQLSAYQLTATANTPGTFTYEPTCGTMLPIGVHELHLTFIPDDGVNWFSATAKVELSVVAGTVMWLNVTTSCGEEPIVLAFGETETAALEEDAFDIAAIPGQKASLCSLPMLAPDKRHLSYDFRPFPGENGITRWRLEINETDNGAGQQQNGAGESNIAVLSWDIGAAVPERQLYLQQIIDEQPVGYPIDMRATLSLSINSGSIYEIAYAPIMEASVTLTKGWNFIGLPVMAMKTERNSLERLVNSSDGPEVLWYWDNDAYKIWPNNEPLRPELGYFFYSHDESTTLAIKGIKADGVMSLQPGWNFVSIPGNHLMPIAEGTISRVWHLNDSKYQPVVNGDSLKTGGCYWIFINADEPVMVNLGN